MKKELFLSRVSALKAVVQHGKKAGLPGDLIVRKGKATPVYRRGELVGFHAFTPVNETQVQAIKEGMI